MMFLKKDPTAKGFLPDECLTEPPKEFTYLGYILEVIHTMDIDSFRKVVDRSKPSQDIITDYFNSNPKRSEIEYLYSKLSIIVHKYLWGNYKEDISDESIKKKSVQEVRNIIIPKHIGHPWLMSSKLLGLKPGLTHAAVDLYNWELKDKSKPFHLDNLKCQSLITNNPSEEWFYLIMVAIEGECARSIRIMEELNYMLDPEQCYDIDKTRILNKLDGLNSILKHANHLINRMYEKCDPDHFYDVLRIFLGGYSDPKIFPDGLSVDTYDGIVKINSKGGSAAQSTLIPLWDAFLGVKHLPHGEDFLNEMKEYMPASDRNYLDNFKENCYFLKYIKRNRDQDILSRYQSCIGLIKEFRQAHIKIVHKYVIKKLKKNNIHGGKGTGGTMLKNFLSGLINNVKTTEKKGKKYINRDITIVEWINYKIEDNFGIDILDKFENFYNTKKKKFNDYFDVQKKWFEEWVWRDNQRKN